METLNRLYLTDLITASRAHAHTARRLAKAHRRCLAGSLAATAHPPITTCYCGKPVKTYAGGVVAISLSDDAGGVVATPRRGGDAGGVLRMLRCREDTGHRSASWEHGVVTIPCCVLTMP